MAAVPTTLRRDVPLAALAAAATVALAALFVLGGPKAALALALVPVVVAVLVADTASLPAIGLVAFALVPLQYLPLATQNGALSPAIAVVLLLAVKAAWEGRPIRRGPHAVAAVLLGAWVVVETLRSPLPKTSAAWSASLLVLVVVPALLLPGWHEARRRLERTWMALGGLLGLYAVLEFALQRNPVFDRLYQSGSAVLTQGWEVYRVTTSLGHPITNGTFFAIATLICAGHVLRGARGWVPGAMVLSGLALVLTASRGPIIGFGAGLLLLLAVASVSGQSVISRRALAGVVAAIAVLGIGANAYLAQRSSGTEAEGSTTIRVATFEAGERLIGEHWPWGAGAGLADPLKASLPLGDQRRGVESSALQLLISLGLFGLLFAGATVVIAGIAALPWRPEVAAGLVAYVVAGATYNLFESNRPALLLWGLLLGMAVGRPRAETAR